jgi:hypothetical protein
MTVLDIGLAIVGVPEKQIADLKAGLPTLSSLEGELAELEPILEKARPHIEALIPLFKEAAPIVQKAWPQIVAETPLLRELTQTFRQIESS